MRRTLCILALTFVAIAPAFAEDAKTIAQRLDNKWLDAFNKKDAAALTDLYTADAVLLPQGTAEPIIGTEKIRRFMDQMVKENIENMVLPGTQANMLDPKSLYSAGTWAADSGGQKINGTYLSVIVQDGTSWKYRADTWNMMPPPPVTTGSAATTK